MFTTTSTYNTAVDTDSAWLSSEQNPEECDATKADSSNAARFIIKTTIISKTQFKNDNNGKREL